MNENLEQIMIDNFNNGETAYKNNKAPHSFVMLTKAYKIAEELNNSIYMDKCASLLVDVCNEAAKYYFKLAKTHFESNEYQKCTKYLKLALKISKIGCKFEQPYKKNVNAEFLKEIKAFLKKNKKQISSIRKKKIISVKNRCLKVIKNVGGCVGGYVGDFFAGMFSFETNEYSNVSSSKYSSSNNSSNLKEYNSEDDEDYKDAKRYYNAGYDYYNHNPLVHRISYLEDAIESFKKCDYYAGCKYPTMKHDARKMIATCYYELGTIKENEGSSCMTTRDYSLASDYYFTAESYYTKGQEYLPRDCYDYFDEAIQRVCIKKSDADYKYKYDD